MTIISNNFSNTTNLQKHIYSAQTHLIRLNVNIVKKNLILRTVVIDIKTLL